MFAGAILINNSRTGLVCFAVCAGLYCLRNPKKIVSSMRVTSMLVLTGAAGLYIMQLMLATRSGLTGFIDDNGRIGPILEAIRLLPQHIFAGIGGSATDYIVSSIGVSVHNFFVAYLIQFGVCGGLAVNAMLLSPIFSLKNRYWYFLCCGVLGGMLFAAFTADDLWMKVMSIKGNIPVVKSQTRCKALCISKGRQQVTLAHKNVDQNLNDRVMQELLKYYPEVMQILLKDVRSE